MGDKKRAVVEEMFKGLERSSFASERLRRQYQGGLQEMEGQSESASPEQCAADQVEERAEAVPRDGVYVARKVNAVRHKVEQMRGKRNEQRQHKAEQTSKGQGMPAREKAGYPVYPQGKSIALQQSAGTNKNAKDVSVQRMLKQKTTGRISAKQKGTARIKDVFSGMFKGISKVITSDKTVVLAGAVAVVLVVMMVCMVGMLCGSTFGIFLTGQKPSGTSLTMKAVIAELEQEYEQKLSELSASVKHDELIIEGEKPEWKEVIAVYAVKINLDAIDAQEIVSMDNRKKELLKKVFWDMVTISYSLNKTIIIETQGTEEEDSENASTENNQMETGSTEASEEKNSQSEWVIMMVAIECKSVEEIGEFYHFTDEQKEHLTELLDERNDLLWEGVIR